MTTTSLLLAMTLAVSATVLGDKSEHRIEFSAASHLTHVHLLDQRADKRLDVGGGLGPSEPLALDVPRQREFGNRPPACEPR